MGANPHARGSGVAQRACERCGARLRRENPGELCDLCSRCPDIAQRLREAGLFAQAGVRRALGAYDFGYLFRAVRRTTELTQAQLGVLLDLDQDRISRVERGERPLQDIAVIARIASRLDIPPVLLGFNPDAVTVDRAATSVIGLEVDWVQRRNFSWAAAGILLGLSVTALDIERLTALLPADPTLVPRRIGTADVAAIEQVTEVFRGLIFSHGGGACRPATVAQLQSVLPLQDAACTEQVRERMLIATIDLGTVAAWGSYDAEHHNDARQLFLLALSVAAQAEHPQATDLTAYLLMDMAHQALHLRQPQQALELIQLGYATAARRAQPLSASTASYLASYQAWGEAAQGDTRSCARALGDAVEHFTRIDPVTAAPWAAHITAAELAAQQGHAYYTLAQTIADPAHAAQAVPLLQQAVDSYGPAYTHSRALTLPGLAGSQALIGDIAAAARTGHQAVQEITALASPRAYDRLRTLDTVLAPHGSVPAIGEVRGKIQAALAAA